MMKFNNYVAHEYNEHVVVQNSYVESVFIAIAPA